MSSPLASITGIASGLDWRSLIDQMMKIAHRPIDMMQETQATLDKQKTDWSDLKTRLATLSSKQAALQLSTTFNGRTATSSNDLAVGATATSTAATGTYLVNVTQLAQQHVISSDTKDPTVALGYAGTFSITSSGVTVSVTLTGTEKLSDIAALINNAKDATGNPVGVTATVINGSSATSAQLVLKAKSSGAANAISIADTTGTAAQSLGLITATGTIKNQVQAAQDANFTVDGLAVTRSSNTVTDVITGVTLNLKTITTSPVTITVGVDTQAAANAIKDWVSAYNSVLDLINAKIAKGGDLQGDPTLARLELALQKQATDLVTGATPGYDAISKIGITTSADRSGKLTVDDTKLSAALSQNTTGVQQLFYNSTAGVTGVGQKLDGTIALYTTNTYAIIPARLSSLDDRYKDLGNQITLMQQRLDQRHDTLVQQFTAMEQALAALQQQTADLNSRLSALA